MLQVHLQPEIEAWLAATATAQGLSAEGYVQKLIAAQIPQQSSRKSRAESRADWERFFVEMAIHADKIPQLPESAFTRESFYGERG